MSVFYQENDTHFVCTTKCAAHINGKCCEWSLVTCYKTSLMKMFIAFVFLS
jgi:hypothetical protein